MIRVLGLIAFVGFVVMLACFAGAAALGGRDLAEHGWRIPEQWNIHVDDHDDGDWDDDAGGSGGETTREIAWNGARSLDVDVPAELRFTQAPGAGKLTVSGPKGSVDHVVVENGVVKFDQPMHHTRRLLIVMTAPNVTRFGLNGDDKLSVADYRQDQLALDIAGSAEASVRGEAKAFDLQISGSGEADLSQLTAEDGKVDIAGSGRATVGPKSSAEIDISGSGEVTLLTRPGTLRSHVTGSGRINDGATAED